MQSFEMNKRILGKDRSDNTVTELLKVMGRLAAVACSKAEHDTAEKLLLHKLELQKKLAELGTNVHDISETLNKLKHFNGEGYAC